MTRVRDRRKQMNSALVIGGTGFVGRHTVRELLDQDYDVTTISRDRHGFRFGEEFPITRITADRTDEDALADVARRLGPDLVVDGAAFYPGEVRTATEIFADVEAYIYVSSGGVYDAHAIPKREDETPLHSFSPEQADDDSMATYGPRKAECDRETAAAVDRGVTAMSVRPTMIYGPKTVPSSDSASGTTGDEAPSWADDLPGFQGHHDYWIDRLNRFDRVVVPGDGTAIWHRAYVEDVASAIRVVAEAEQGEPGEAYNVADRRVCTMEDVIPDRRRTRDLGRGRPRERTRTCRRWPRSGRVRPLSPPRVAVSTRARHLQTRRAGMGVDTRRAVYRPDCRGVYRERP